MEIIIDSLIEGARRARGVVIVIDVFRAFSTSAAAFISGAEKIILVDSPAAALQLRDAGIADLCMGEVQGKAPPGFDFGNSPYQLSRADVRGKTIAHSTMAGTVGVVNAARNADVILQGSLVLAKATVAAVRLLDPDLVTIVAMGDGGKIRADEDEQCALYIRNLLEGRQPDPEAVRSLILAGAEARKYEDPTRPHFDPEDRRMALGIDSSPFAIRVRREDDLLVARPEPV